MRDNKFSSSFRRFVGTIPPKVDDEPRTQITKSRWDLDNRYYENFVVELLNPFCYPRFRLSASGSPQLDAFAFRVPVDINGFHPYTDRSSNL